MTATVIPFRQREALKLSMPGDYRHSLKCRLLEASARASDPCVRVLLHNKAVQATYLPTDRLTAMPKGLRLTPDPEPVALAKPPVGWTVALTGVVSLAFWSLVVLAIFAIGATLS
jgi:hypothetical protein